jgi:hypothetical protein
MPIVWGVNHAARLVSAKATGELGRTDIEDYLDGLEAAATLSYRKVLDMTQSRLALSGEDMAALGNRIRTHESMRPMGSVAVIAGSEELYDRFRLFESVVDANRQLKIFRNAEMAYAWLAVGLPDGRERAETRRLAVGPAAFSAG